MLTIGHSTHPIQEFTAILNAHRVETLVDVRKVPRSRHNPQFERTALLTSLPAAGIAYHHMPELGGLRHPRHDSLNTGWRNASFRGYADYMQTPEFTAALDALIALDRHHQVAIMCAEAVPWRCHRSLIADALTVRGIPVEHIMNAITRNPHKLTPFAKIDGDRITYPADNASLFVPDEY